MVTDFFFFSILISTEDQMIRFNTEHLLVADSVNINHMDHCLFFFLILPHTIVSAGFKDKGCKMSSFAATTSILAGI